MLQNLASVLNGTVEGDTIVVGDVRVRCTLVGYVVAQSSAGKVVLGSTAHDVAFLAGKFRETFR